MESYSVFLLQKLSFFKSSKALLLLFKLHQEHLSRWQAQESPFATGKVIHPKKEATALASVKDT